MSYEKVVGFREVDFFLCWRVGVWIEVRFLSCLEYYNLCILFCLNSNFGIISWCFLLWGYELSKFIITHSSIEKLSFCTWSVHVQGFSCKIPVGRWKNENLSLIAVLFSFVLVGCLKGKWQLLFLHSWMEVFYGWFCFNFMHFLSSQNGSIVLGIW